MDSSTIENDVHKMIIYLLENYNETSWFENNLEHTTYDTDDDNNEISTNQEYNKDFDFDLIATNADEEDTVDDSYTYLVSNDIRSTEVNVLSKESTHTATNERSMKRSLSESAVSGITLKKFRDDNSEASDTNEKDLTPDYLRLTNARFQFVMTVYSQNYITTTTNTISFEDLQLFALLKHHIAIIQQQQKLWQFYLKLGTGQGEIFKSCTVDVKDRYFWSSCVRSKASSFLQTISTADEQRFYETFVNSHLQELHKSLTEYHNNYSTKKSNFLISFTPELEQIIDAYVQHFGVQPFEMKINYKIALLQYEYEAHLLECQYQQYKSNDYQIRIAERLYYLQHEYIRTKMDLLEYKTRIFYNNPPKSISSAALSAAAAAAKRNKQKLDKECFIVSYEKQVQKIINDLMIESISMLELHVSDTHNLLKNELNQISINDKNDDNSLTNGLVDLIFRQFKIIQKKLECITNYRINYVINGRHQYLGEDNIDEEVEEQQQTTTDDKHISFSPTVIVNKLSHQFTNEQLKLLNRGPSYTPLCQLCASSTTTSVSFRHMIEKQYKLLQHNLSILFTKYKMNTARSMFINKTIKDMYMKIFDVPVPKQIRERAVYEKRLVQSIRKDLKTNDLIIRRLVDQKNTFYITNRNDFQTLSDDFLLKTDAFELCNIISSSTSHSDPNHSITTANTTLQTIQNYFKQITKAVNIELEKILHNKKFYADLLDKLRIDENKFQLPYLYFLPDINETNIVTVQPVIVAKCSATFRLAQYLNELFEPLLERQSLSISFKNGTDFIQKLNYYAKERKSLRINTFFIKLTITNFHKITSHTVMLSVLEQFLRDHLAIPGIGNLSIQKLVNLTALFLNHNYFFYNNQIYRCIKGGPSSLSLTNTLSQIYIYQWQQFLLNQAPSLSNELFGRCKNEIFFTWNQSTSEYKQLFAKLSEKGTDIQYKITVGYQIQFLNINIENRNGTLYTNVSHVDNIHKYALPFVVGNTEVEHSHWLQSALIRAVRYCTYVDDFNRERVYLEVTCLANGYPLDFIERRINHFYTYFNVKSLRSRLDQDLYHQLRERLFDFIRIQKQFQLENDELEKKKRRFQLSYLYEYGSKRQFNQQLQHLLFEYLNKALHLEKNQQINIILTAKQQYSLNSLLSEQKPQLDFSIN